MIKELLKEKDELQDTINNAKWYINHTSPTYTELLIHQEMMAEAWGRIYQIDDEIEKLKVIEARDKKIDSILNKQ